PSTSSAVVLVPRFLLSCPTRRSSDLDPWLMILPWHLGCHYLPSPPPMPDFLVTLSQLILTCWVLKVALVNTLTGWVSIFAASCYLAARLSLDNYKHC